MGYRIFGQKITGIRDIKTVVRQMGVLGQFLYILLIYALFELDLGNPVSTGFGQFVET